MIINSDATEEDNYKRPVNREASLLDAKQHPSPSDAGNPPVYLASYSFNAAGGAFSRTTTIRRANGALAGVDWIISS
ncbi:unnamed protein product [Lasius platythorax]|uniref:Uncharacterized protein n=1 Tax=Lasius platythorax TaxID=488582 RepID=A0AAV2P310_9HYME